MRKVLKHILPVLVCAVAAGCHGWLDVRPQGYVIPQTDEEFAALVHNHLRDIEGGADEYIIGNVETLLSLEGIADNLDANVRTGNLPSYAGEEINKMQSWYRGCWEVVRDCNIVISNLRGRDGETARGALSAAFAMKGAVYANMIRRFCEPVRQGAVQTGLPLVDEFEISSMPGRSALGETVSYTIGLFDEALALEPEDGLFYFTTWRVKALKARLLFWSGDWEGTASLCREIIGGAGLSLCPAAEYAAMMEASGPSGEVLLKSHINDSSELEWYFSAIKSYFATRPASAQFIALFGEEPEKDVRYGVCIDRRRLNAKLPEMRLRLSEIVLMLAESCCHLGLDDEALAQLNALRLARIEGAVPYTAATLPPVRRGERISKDAEGKPLTPLLQAILDERRKELFMEGDRWFELKRGGRPEWWVLSGGLKYTTRQYLYTFPIYRGDVDLNPDMVQNPGYED